MEKGGWRVSNNQGCLSGVARRTSPSFSGNQKMAAIIKAMKNTTTTNRSMSFFLLCQVVTVSS